MSQSDPAISELIPDPALAPHESSVSNEELDELLDECGAYELTGGKPFHGWSCECPECLGHDANNIPRPGELPRFPLTELT